MLTVVRVLSDALSDSSASLPWMLKCRNVLHDCKPSIDDSNLHPLILRSCNAVQESRLTLVKDEHRKTCNSTRQESCENCRQLSSMSVTMSFTREGGGTLDALPETIVDRGVGQFSMMTSLRDKSSKAFPV